MRIAVLHGSTREEGNTEALTEIVLDGLERTDIYLRGKTIRPIHDQRHEEGGFDPVDDDYDGIVQDVLEHDILVFTTPVYWYGPSGILKNFIDRWSQSLRDTRYNFKEAMAKKKAYVIVVGETIRGSRRCRSFRCLNTLSISWACRWKVMSSVKPAGLAILKAIHGRLRRRNG